METVADTLLGTNFLSGLLNTDASLPLVSTSASDLSNLISAAPYASDQEKAAAMQQLYADTQASAADALRRQAASDLGYDSVQQGTVDEYRNLTADQQVALTDRMARIIVTNPSLWSDQAVAVANARVNNPYYGTPLADSSISGNLMTSIADGSFVSDALGGAQDYLKYIFWLAVIAGAVYLVSQRPKVVYAS